MALLFGAMSRRQRISKAPAVRPTYSKILEQAMLVLNEDGFDRFSVQKVLEGAEVSRATLYRHFPDVDALIEAALVENFRQVVDLYTRVVSELIEFSTDLSGFREGLRAFLKGFSSIPPEVRLRRTHTIALGSTRPELGAAIAPVQETLTDGWEQNLRRAQRRGFIRKDLDTRVAAVVIQAITLGRIVDDAAVSHVGDERWANSIFEFLDRAYFEPDR